MLWFIFWTKRKNLICINLQVLLTRLCRPPQTLQELSVNCKCLKFQIEENTSWPFTPKQRHPSLRLSHKHTHVWTHTRWPWQTYKLVWNWQKWLTLGNISANKITDLTERPGFRAFATYLRRRRPSGQHGNAEVQRKSLLVNLFVFAKKKQICSAAARRMFEWHTVM